MATHYDVLGVDPSVGAAQARQAYRERARRLHPDGHAGRSPAEIDAARRAMQDVNEAWRVLRDARTRAAYDRNLLAAMSAASEHGADGWLDEPYRHAPAEAGDLTVAIVRPVPWIAVLVVLAAIFFFTAFARNGNDDAVGSCVTIEDGRATEVASSAPNDGLIVDVVDQANLCGAGSEARMRPDGDWWCLR